jgi:GIY-YIG catalytic domain
MPTKAQIEQEIAKIVRLFQKADFESGIPVAPTIAQLTQQTGVYAIKHRDLSVLYVGKANNFRTRFQSGHDALLKILLSGTNPVDIYIVLYPLRGRWVEYILELEKLVIFSLTPSYNKRVPSVAEVTQMVSTAPRPITSGHLKDILRYLPDHILGALEDYADANQLNDLQVIEMAIAGFLDLESTEFRHVEDLESIAAMRNKISLLQTKVELLTQAMQNQGFTLPEGL